MKVWRYYLFTCRVKVAEWLLGQKLLNFVSLLIQMDFYTKNEQIMSKNNGKVGFLYQYAMHPLKEKRNFLMKLISCLFRWAQGGSTIKCKLESDKALKKFYCTFSTSTLLFLCSSMVQVVSFVLVWCMSTIT